jgi:hypothetical protein
VIDLKSCPNFRLLLWDMPGQTAFEDRYVFHLLEERCSRLRKEDLTANERELVGELAARFGGGIFAGFE